MKATTAQVLIAQRGGKVEMLGRTSVHGLLRSAHSLLALLLWLGFTAPLSAQWVEQGPGPIINGQDIGLTNPTNPVSGAVNAIVPVDANTAYVGTVNGGVWKTTDAGATWAPLTDTALKALSIRSLAVSPLDNLQVFAGTGSSSSFSNAGSAGIGVARSIDGGVKWTTFNSVTDVNGNTTAGFTGERITSIVPTSVTGVVLASTQNQGSSGAPFGLFRSTDNGATFTQLSGSSASGLPGCGVTSIAADPVTTTRFYAAAPPNFCFANQTAGIYKSEDSGLTWTAVNGTSNATANPPVDTTIKIGNSKVILLSVSKADSTIYAMVITTGGDLGGVFYSKDQGANWTQMDTPAATIFPGHQGGNQGAIVAHPTLKGIVYIGGDYHPSVPDPNANGCTNFGGNILRGDNSAAAGSQWADVVCNGAAGNGVTGGTAPHADSRTFAFSTDGTVLYHGCDGGLFKLVNPDAASATRQWFSFNGNIRPTETHNVAFDPLSHILISGNQDVGSAYQTAVGSLTWTDYPTQGDGSFVGVDADQTAHSGTSYRYESYIKLQTFNRHTYDNNNNETAAVAVGLMITSGAGNGSTLIQADNTRQFNNPWVLNNINPARMLIGTSSIYESLDRGDTLANLGAAGAQVSSLSYGSRKLNATTGVLEAFPDAFYVGAGKTILHRVTSGGGITTLTLYPGSAVVALVMDPMDYTHVDVIDDSGKVWSSFDEGGTWEDGTGDLAKKISQPQTIELFSPPPTATNKREKDTHLIVGGIGGVVKIHPRLHERAWTEVARGLPKAFFYDVHYNAACDTLVAGSMGRGAWTITSPFPGGTTANCPALPAAAAAAQLTQTRVVQVTIPSTEPVPPLSALQEPVSVSSN